eukprot:9060429-Alexandrium_andersonii.AAC.1
MAALRVQSQALQAILQNRQAADPLLDAMEPFSGGSASVRGAVGREAMRRVLAEGPGTYSAR